MRGNSRGVAERQQQLRPEQLVLLIIWLAGKIELCRQIRPRRLLKLHMKMPGSAGIAAGDNRCEAIYPVVAGKLMPPTAVAVVIIGAVVIGMPEVDEHASQWHAG